MRAKNMYRIALALLLVAALLVTAACQTTQPTATPVPPKPAEKAPAAATPKPAAPAATPAAKAPAPATTPVAKAASGTPYTINVINSLTAQLAFVGASQKLGLEMYEKYVNARGGINGQPVKFALNDDQSSPKVAVQVATDIIAKKVPVIIGPVFTASTLAVVPLVSNGPVLYSTGPAVRPEPNSYVFGSLPANYDQFLGLINFFRNKGWNKIALLATTDASGQDIAEIIYDVLKKPENKGMSLVADEKAEPTATSVAAQMAKIKAASPQALILGAAGMTVSTGFKGAMQAGLNIPIATSQANQNYAAMQANKDVLPAELYFPGTRFDTWESLPAGPAKDINAEFRKMFADIGVKPDIANPPTWEAAMVVVEALRKTGTDTTAAKLKDTIQGVKGVEGIFGNYNFTVDNHRGLTPDAVEVVRWDAIKGTWVAASGPGGALLKNQ